MKVAIIGTGYVGLVSGACLADHGHEVICVDIDAKKIESITLAKPPIHEVGLEEMLKRVVPDRLSATTDLAAAVQVSDMTLIAVGTPFDGEEIDLTYIRTAAQQIGEALRDKDEYHVVVVKSTVVPGTTEDVVLPILSKASGKQAGADFGVGMNPEFLKEGEAIADFNQPDRVVLGGIDERTLDRLAELYAIYPDVDVLRTNPRTAEMIKYSANALLATLISFSNEIGNLCALSGTDVVEVLRGVHLDKRFMPILTDGKRVAPGMVSYLAAGCGFGGSCFPKDVKALIADGKRRGADMAVLDAVVKVNLAQPQRMIEMLREEFPSFKGLKVAVLGMAFKPGTDDVRESPSLAVTDALQEAGAYVTAFDPIARTQALRALRSPVTFADTLEQCVAEVDAVLLMTSWPEFTRLPEILRETSRNPLVVDGRRLLDKGSVSNYKGIGLG